MLTIIAAMEEELAGVRTALSEYARGQTNAGDAVPGLHVIGVGREGLESGLRGVLPTLRQQRGGVEPPTGLLLLGFAGAVDPSLSAGDLTLASHYHRLVPQPATLVAVPGGMIEPEHLERLREQIWARLPPLPRFQLDRPSGMNTVIPRHVALKSLEPDPAMLQLSREALAQGGLTAVETDSMTVEKLITDANTKGDLHRQYHQFGVGTVNMEDYWVARLAAAAKVPFLSVRAVLDTADQGVPSHLLEQARRLRRSDGQAAGWASFGHPSGICALLHLPGQMQLAQESLARFALAFLGCSSEYLPTNQPE